MKPATCGIGLCLTLLAVWTGFVLTSQVDVQGRCDTELLRQFRIECMAENGEVSHGRMVSNGTKCLVGCSRTGVSSRGYRICRNGNWEGNVINCKENAPIVRIVSNRNKRGFRHCTRRCWVGWWWKTTCRTNCIYISSPTIRCPTVASLQHTVRGQTYANVYWNSPTASGGAGNLRIIQTRGFHSGSRFYGRRHHIEYKVVDSRGQQAFCSFSFRVTVRTCNSPTRPSNGRYYCQRYPVIYGTTCSVTCNSGYRVVGQNILTCGAYGRFNFLSPRCEAVKCITPPLNITDGDITCPSDPVYTSSCSIQCKKGFAQSPGGNFVCNQNGRWVGTFNCTDVTPPVFDKCPQNIIVETERNRTDIQVNWVVNATDNSNDDVFLVQTEGPGKSYRLTVGTYNISYTATDKFGHSATCSFTITVKGLACKPATFVEEDKDLVSSCVSLVVGASCSMRCKNNKKLKGDSTITCEKDDRMQTYWNYVNLPNCVVEPCPNLTAPRYGALSCSKWNNGAFCSVQCSSRYQIAREVKELYICGSDGEWTPTDNIPDCVRTRPGSGISVTNELYLYYNGNCEDAKQQIKQNFINKLKDRGTCKVEECTVKNVGVICGATRRRKRSSMSSHSISKRSATEISLVWDVVVNYTQNDTDGQREEISEVKDSLNRIIAAIEIDLKNGTFDDLAPGVRTDKDSLYSYPDDLVCDYGLKPNYQINQTNTCSSCPTGTIYDENKDICEPCPLGTYQDEEASSTCKRCPNGTTTEDVASRHQDNCTQICEVGYFSQTGINPCSPCPIGTFQNETHSTSCFQCPNGKTSLQEASTDISSCKEFDFEIEDAGYIKSGLTPRTSSSHDGSYISEFTFVALLQIKEQGIDMSIQRDGVSYFMVDIGQQINVTISGVSILVPRILNAWFHIVVTVSSSSTGVQLFSLGQLITTKQIGSGTSIPTSNDTALHLQSWQGDRAIVRYLRVMSGLLTAGQISSLTHTCALTDDDILFSLDVFDNLLIRNISAVSPSTCDVINDCLSSTCGNHTCIDKVDGFTCRCKDGYTGTTCDIPPDYCVNHRCENGATCINSPATKNYTCVCASGFRGTLCDYEIVNGGWSDWGNWSQCSVTCKNGVRSRERTCTNPAPDVDGRPCPGYSSETQVCTQPECPECHKSDLTLPVSVDRVTCNGTIDALTCKPFCKEGLISTTDESQFYQCSDGKWSPGTQVAPCSTTTVPAHIEGLIWVKIRGITDCNVITDDAVLQQRQSAVSILPCSTNNNCVSFVEQTGCVTGIKVTITISTNRSEVGLAAALETMEDIANVLQHNASIFDINLNGTIYSSDINATETLICPSGSVFTDKACAACPPGTYYSTVNGTECILCDRGTYQPNMGRPSCLDCPNGLTTEFIGCLNAFKCSLYTKRTV